MSCKHIKDRLADYINATLNKEERAGVERHLEHCASCREELEFLKSYYRGVESLTEVGPPINLLDNIHAELEKPQGFRESFNLLLNKIDRIKLPLEIAGIAAAAALFLFVISPFREMEIGGKKSTYVAMEKMEESLPEVEESAAPPEELKKQTETVTEQKMVEVDEPVKSDEALLLSENVAEIDDREVAAEQEEIVVARLDEPLERSELRELNMVDDTKGDLENDLLNDEELSNAIKLEEKTELAEGDGSYEVALVLRTFSKEEALYQAEQDYTVQKSKRSFANKDMARGTAETSSVEEESASDTLLEEEGLDVQISSIVATFAEATIEFSYQADGVTPREAIIKVKTADYTALLEQLASLGLVEGPQVDPVTVSTTHMRVVLRLEE